MREREYFTTDLGLENPDKDTHSMGAYSQFRRFWRLFGNTFNLCVLHRIGWSSDSLLLNDVLATLVMLLVNYLSH